MKGLYIVTPDWDDTSKIIDVTEKALKGGAEIVQYRHKTAGPELRLEQARALQDLCRRYGKPFIIIDFAENAVLHVNEKSAYGSQRVKGIVPLKFDKVLTGT